MPSSRSEHSSWSPITKIPYDVLREIFIHCLPDRPLQIPQPNTTVTPMLLCQICSCWRTAALATPSLWLHLSYRIHASHIDPNLRIIRTFRQKDLDFLMWWKRRQGSMASFSYLDIKTGTSAQDIRLAKGDMDVLLKYITSAWYLCINSLFWRYIGDEFAAGEEDIFPDPHTLMTDRQDIYFYRAQMLIGRTHTSSALRRLCMNSSSLPVDPDAIITPSHWSKLTHLAMLEITISVTFWFSLIRALPDLEWASISFAFYDEYDIEGEPPSKHTLPRLSTLFLTCCEHSSDYVDLPFALIFTNLYLPALRTLSLLSSAESWEDDHTMSELYTVLDSTPKITTLALRGCDYGFLSLHKRDYPDILSAMGDMDPLWRHAPQLTHLQLDLPCVSGDSDIEAGNALDVFVCNFFWPDAGWLALDDVACPIRRVTFIADNAWSPDFNTVRDLTASSILSRAGEVSNIFFEIVSEAAVDDAGSQAWRAWGSRNE